MTGVLVVAKAPVPGQVKTRLGAAVGEGAAAVLAAAALLDTIDVCERTFGARSCTLALSGDLGSAEEGDQIGDRLAAWTVFPQRGQDFATRLEHAHRVAFEHLERPVVQVGMDTPQMTTEHLHRLSGRLDQYDAVLAPAHDGGWWALGVTDPCWLRGLGGVPMSTDATGDLTRRHLLGNGAQVALGDTLRDIDYAADADQVSGEAPTTRFARAWLALPQHDGVAA